MGGSVFKGVQISHIPNKPTVITELAFQVNAIFRHQLGRFFQVGSRNKKFLGDLDLAVSEERVKCDVLALSKNTGDDVFWQELELHLKDKCKEHPFIINKGLRQVHILLPLRRLNAKTQKLIDEQGYNEDGTRTGVPGFVQVDILIGLVPWMRKILSGAPKKSKWKALYRTNLLREIVRLIRWTDIDGDMHRLALDYKRGVRELVYRMVPPTGKQKVPQEIRIRERYVTKSPNGLAMMLFGPSVQWKDINSFEKLYAQCISPNFRYPLLLNQASESLVKELIQQNKPIPFELS